MKKSFWTKRFYEDLGKPERSLGLFPWLLNRWISVSIKRDLLLLLNIFIAAHTAHLICKQQSVQNVKIINLSLSSLQIFSLRKDHNIEIFHFPQNFFQQSLHIRPRPSEPFSDDKIVSSGQCIRIVECYLCRSRRFQVFVSANPPPAIHQEQSWY